MQARWGAPQVRNQTGSRGRAYLAPFYEGAIDAVVNVCDPFATGRASPFDKLRVTHFDCQRFTSSVSLSLSKAAG